MRIGSFQEALKDTHDQMDVDELSKTDELIGQAAMALRAAFETLAHYDLSGCFEKFGVDLKWAHKQLLKSWSKDGSMYGEVADLDAFLDNSDLLEELADRVRAEEGKDMKEPALSFEVLRLELHWLAHLASLEHVDQELVRREGEAIEEADTRRVFERLCRLSGRAEGMNHRLWEFKERNWWHVVFHKLDTDETELWECAGHLLAQVGKLTIASSHLLETKVGSTQLQKWRESRLAYNADINTRPCSCLLWICWPAWETPKDLRDWRNSIGHLIRVAEARLPKIEDDTASLGACKAGTRERR